MTHSQQGTHLYVGRRLLTTLSRRRRQLNNNSSFWRAHVARHAAHATEIVQQTQPNAIVVEAENDPSEGSTDHTHTHTYTVLSQSLSPDWSAPATNQIIYTRSRRHVYVQCTISHQVQVGGARPAVGGAKHVIGWWHPHQLPAAGTRPRRAPCQSLLVSALSPCPAPALSCEEQTYDQQ